MNKNEIREIKKLFTPTHCAVNRICGCYVDAEKNQKMKLSQNFLSLEEEASFKYFKIFRSVLSGTLGKNMLNMEFPLDAEMPEGSQEFLLKLRDSRLEDEELLEEFYAKVMEDYIYPENYYIILIHGSYDIPGQGSDEFTMDDASDYVYDFVLSAICPVKLDKPGLHYNTGNNLIENRIQDWVVGVPQIGFLFPAFNDRNTDIHSVLFYTRSGELDQPDFTEHFLGCRPGLSPKIQQNVFQSLIEETLEEACDFETVMTIQENLNTMLEQKKDEPEPLVLDKREVRRLLEDSGVANEQMEQFDDRYDEVTEGGASFVASNIAPAKTMKIKMPDVVIQVSPDSAQLIETRIIDGVPYILIEAREEVEINGIMVKPATVGEEEEVE